MVANTAGSSRFEIRAALAPDEDALLALAGHLNTVNLPNDRRHIRELLALSEASFSAQLQNPALRKYTFLLWDHETNSAVGTSSIIAKLGRRDAPYIYLDVIPEEKYSKAVDRHFHHTLLRIGYSYDGPTELGGLVVLPSHRRGPERLGIFVSYVRFLHIAALRHLFQRELLAELLPPLEKDGTSHLWEALGRRFTGMTYSEADLLSSQNKDFIRDLFPGGAIYASVLSSEAQAVIGKVGEPSRGVETMLRRVGFRYAERVDPFDGGPHFVAMVDEVAAIRDTRPLVFAGALPAASSAAVAPGSAQNGIVARFSTLPPYAQALKTSFAQVEDNVLLPPAAIARLQLSGGELIHCLQTR